MKNFLFFSLNFFLLLFPAFVRAGVISDAQPLAVSLTKILNFLLLVFGLIAILGMILAGIIYFTAQGDERRIYVAKRAFQGGIVGVIVVLGSMVLVFTIAQLLS